MKVFKFGGTSVGSAESIARTADIVLNHRKETARIGLPAALDASVTGDPRNDSKALFNDAIVVVVSAMSGVTDQLIEGARAAAEGDVLRPRQIKAELLHRHLEVVDTLLSGSAERYDITGVIEECLHELERLYRSIAVLGELTARGRDAVASLGEQLSSRLLAAVLRQRGVRAEAVSATRLLVTDDRFGAAAPLMDKTRQRLQEEIKPLLERELTPVITGYVGATERGVTTTLGRGGSDYSAAIIGTCLDAREVWIWTDVDGILTADPNLVPNARSLVELSYAEAADIAYFGADVLHPKTIRPAVRSGIPLRIVNTFNPEHPGTLITGTPSPGRERLPAIISSTGLSMIAVGSPDDSWTPPMAARALQLLAAGGIETLMFSQSFCEHSLNLVVRQQDQAHSLTLLCREFGSGPPVENRPEPEPGVNPASQRFHALNDTCSLGVKERVATLSVVGVPGWNGTGLAARAFAALGTNGMRVIAVIQAANEDSVSFCIAEDQAAGAVRLLHRELRLEANHG